MKFVLAFNRLKQMTNGDPQNLVKNVDNNSEMFDLVADIEAHFYLLNSRFKGRQKIIGPIPRAYVDALSEFKKHWEAAFSYINYIRFCREFPEFNQVNEPVDFLDYVHINYEPELIEADPRLHSSFEPGRHHGWKAINALIEIGRNECDRRVSYDDEKSLYYENVEKIADGALIFLRKDIGIDMNAIFERYYRVPDILVGKVVSNRHGMTEKGRRLLRFVPVTQDVVREACARRNVPVTFPHGQPLET